MVLSATEVKKYLRIYGKLRWLEKINVKIPLFIFYLSIVFVVLFEPLQIDLQSHLSAPQTFVFPEAICLYVCKWFYYV